MSFIGKNITFKNVDWSAVSIESIKRQLLDFDENRAFTAQKQNTPADKNLIFFINPVSAYQGKTIKGIRLKFKSSSTTPMDIGIWKCIVRGSKFYQVTKAATLSARPVSTLMHDYDFATPIKVEANQAIGISIPSDAANDIMIVSSANNASHEYGTPQTMIGAGSPTAPITSGTFTQYDSVFMNLYY